MDIPSHKFCVAPMMDRTDRHCRYFLRLISKHALLYTEMIPSGALLYGNHRRFLEFHQAEQPLAIQLGGSDPEALARCSILAEQAGFREINLNVGCPSERVRNGMIGACLMAEPELLGDCIQAMREAVTIPVTLKSRIGIDTMDSFDELAGFIAAAAGRGCRCFILHARIAILHGLSPKQNREIPPLNYQRVYQIKEAFPELEIIINGGIKTLQDAKRHLSRVDGVMLGREAYQHPYLLADVDRALFNSSRPVPSRQEVMDEFIAYAEAELHCGTELRHIVRHIFGLFQGQPGGKKFRRFLSENAGRLDAGPGILENARQLVQ